jgi:hypothetical protein
LRFFLGTRTFSAGSPCAVSVPSVAGTTVAALGEVGSGLTVLRSAGRERSTAPSGPLTPVISMS